MTKIRYCFLLLLIITLTACVDRSLMMTQYPNHLRPQDYHPRFACQISNNAHYTWTRSALSIRQACKQAAMACQRWQEQHQQSPQCIKVKSYRLPSRH